jgi:hypothetical protein
MKRLIAVFVAVSLAIFGLSASATDGFTYTNLGAPALAPGGLTVTLNSLQIVEKSGSTQLVISYTQKNNTADKKLNEGSFKLFFTDGSSEPQYGFFNTFFPGDGNSRSYTWEWLKGKDPWLIEWEAGFFTAKPTANGLKWKVGTTYPVPSATSTPTPTTAPPASSGTATQAGLMYEFKATNYSPTTGQWANTSGVNAAFVTRSVVLGNGVPLKSSSPDSVEFNGARNGFQFITNEGIPGPKTFSLDVWFRTSAGGKIVGFESSGSLTNNFNYDRHLYVGSDGRLYFGVFPGSHQVVNTSQVVNDGLWHHAMAVFSDETATLYLDGKLIQTKRTGPAESFFGNWRVGGYKLNDWFSSSDRFFEGSIGEARIYNRALTATEVSNSHAQNRATYTSRPTPTLTPTPAPTATAKPAPKPVKYKNCAALQKVYAGGVALSSKSVNKGGKIKQKPTVNAKVYNLNKSLDRDKDGLACER